jgi:hypothetical protein
MVFPHIQFGSCPAAHLLSDNSTTVHAPHVTAVTPTHLGHGCSKLHVAVELPVPLGQLVSTALEAWQGLLGVAQGHNSSLQVTAQQQQQQWKAACRGQHDASGQHDAPTLGKQPLKLPGSHIIDAAWTSASLQAQ